MGSADLHVATKHSDDVGSPCAVVSATANVGLSAQAITDPPTLSALTVARPEVDRLGLMPNAGSDFHTHDHPGRGISSTTTPGPDRERLRRVARPPSADLPVMSAPDR